MILEVPEGERGPKIVITVTNEPTPPFSKEKQDFFRFDLIFSVAIIIGDIHTSHIEQRTVSNGLVDQNL